MSESPVAPPSRLGDRSVPDGWAVVERQGIGPFTTRAVLEDGGGHRYTWTSRRHRKQLGLLALGGRRRRLLREGLQRVGVRTWAMGAAFALGSVCFALGSLPLFFDRTEPSTVALVFFVGSLLFTTAAYLQFHESVAAPADVGPDARPLAPLAALAGLRPRSIDWWASLVQLIGTVMFNLSTWSATRQDLDVDQQRRLIWAPDVVGSVCFLLASWLAYAEVNDGVRPRPDGSVGWWIAALNMAGSIAFGLAAVGARYLATTGEPANIALVNAGTFLGAICFLAGAVLLPVEAARDRVEADDAAA